MVETELDVALDTDDRRIWAELGLDDETIDVPVRRRTDPLPRVRISAKPRPPAIPNVTTIDRRTYSQRWHAGQLLPGTYRIVDDQWRDRSTGQLKWDSTLTVPSRIPAWVRSAQGRLWHRVRWAEIVWADRVGDDLPHLRVTTWCGPSFFARRSVPPPWLFDEPRGRVCTKCDPTVPDRRRLPDLLEELNRA